MKYQPIKFTEEQYRILRAIIRKEFGNISLAKGIYLMSVLYKKHVPFGLRNKYRRIFYAN